MNWEWQRITTAAEMDALMEFCRSISFGRLNNFRLKDGVAGQSIPVIFGGNRVSAAVIGPTATCARCGDTVSADSAPCSSIAYCTNMRKARGP